jgi:hypothetical protein
MIPRVSQEVAQGFAAREKLLAAKAKQGAAPFTFLVKGAGFHSDQHGLEIAVGTTENPHP